MNEYKMILSLSEVITPFETIKNGIIAIGDDGRIAFVGPKEKFKGEKEDTLDLGDKIAIPGLIDIHIHGAMGADTMDGEYASLVKISKFLASKGVTSFLPTTTTSPLEDTFRALDAIKEAKMKGTGFARVIGAHLEGPYFNKDKAGAQDIKYIRDPNINEIKSIIDKYGNVLVRMTLAPELPGAIEAIRYITKKGIIASIGHTNATYEEAIMAINAGANLANHVFNAMRGFHHRDPGVLGAVLTRDDVFVEIIIDEIHHHDAARKIVIKCKGVERVALISDSIMATGLKDGEYMLGKQRIIVKNGISRLLDGTLAGSTTTLDRSIKHVVEKLNLALVDAVKMATYVPARILGLENEIGVIKMGSLGDITVLNRDLTVYMTIVNGNIVYSR